MVPKLLVSKMGPAGPQPLQADYGGLSWCGRMYIYSYT